MSDTILPNSPAPSWTSLMQGGPAQGTKTAESYGASSLASAAENTAAIQEALDAGGQPSLVTPGTYLVTDTFSPAGNLFIAPGVRLVTSAGAPPSTLTTVVRSSASTSRGYRTVLFGDSMTDLYQQIQAPISSLSYNRATGDLTIGYTSHQQAVGWYTYYWDRNYAALSEAARYQITSRVDANTLVINVGANLPGVPNGSLVVGRASMRPESLQNAETWFTWFQYISGNRFNVVYNGAQSGDTSDECLARVQSACLDYAPDVVFMQMPGVNDAGDTDVNTIVKNRHLLVDAILSQVPILVLLTTTPVATGEVRATSRIMQRVQYMNQRLREYVRNKANVLLVDAYGTIVDPSDANGLALANYLRTSDKIHYSMRGGKVIADQVWAQVSSAFPTREPSLPTSTADNFISSAVSLSAVTRANNVVTATAASHGYFTGEVAKVFSATGASEALNEWVTVTRVNANTVSFPSVGADGSITGTIYLGTNNNLMTNPTLTGAGGAVGGGIAGVYATGLSAFLNGSPTPVTGSLVSRADGYGQNQRTVLTFAGANDYVSVVTSITDITRHIKAGRTYVLEAEVSLTDVSGSNLSEIRFNLAAVADGVTCQTYALAGYTSGAGLNADAGPLTLRTPPLVMPTFTAVTQMRMDFTLRGSAAGTALTVDIGRIALREYDSALDAQAPT